MIKDTFIKIERLSGKTTIDQLFSSDKSFFCHPFRVAYRVLSADEKQDTPCRVLMNVPKRLHKSAVTRNHIKRKIKEAYRLDKNNFYTQLGDQRIQVALLYSSKEKLPYEEISAKWLKAKQRLLKELAQ